MTKETTAAKIVSDAAQTAFNVRNDERNSDYLERLVRLETKLDELIKKVQGMTDGIGTTIDKHESRIYTLETKVHDFSLTWKLLMVLAGFIGSVATLIFPYLMSALGFTK